MRSGGTVPRRPDLAGHTFRFADFSGFAALTEAYGDEQAPTSSAGFCAAARRLLAEQHADEVRAIGDALLIPAGDPAVAIRLGLAPRARRWRPERLPAGAGGHAHRSGRGARRRLVGATVNVAARGSAAVRQGHTARPACRSTRSAGWRLTPGMVRAGAPIRVWSTACVRLRVRARSPYHQALVINPATPSAPARCGYRLAGRLGSGGRWSRRA